MPRKLKSQDENPYDVIRGMWEGAYVSHFVRLFTKKFGFSCLTTRVLEEALVLKESATLADIFARLLRYLTGKSDILIANFDSFLRNLLIKEKAQVPRFLDNGTTWQDLTPEEKLVILKWLIDHVHQEKEEDIADYLDENFSPDDLRGICAGQDAFNNLYWYLDDLRLYREIPQKKHSKKVWECVCTTLSDWHTFLKQFRKTSNTQEKDLYSYLNFELFPIIEGEILEEKRKPLHSNKEENTLLIKREREELVMLEKKKKIDCSSGVVKPNVNGTDAICPDKHNGTPNPVKVTAGGNGLSEFVIKTEDNKTLNNMNHCDGHLNITDTISSITSSLTVPTMDIKTSSVTNMCENSCSSSCVTTCSQVSCTVTSSDLCSNGTVSVCSSSVASTSTILSSKDCAQEVNVQQQLSDIPSDSSSVTSNKENAPPSSSTSGNDVLPMSAMSNMVGSTTTPATTASVQPLPSNMVNKTSFPMETQYMQQQSQIFVFSTTLANKAAESYLSGNFPSIIAFHCAQPGTKSFLEKYPLKVQQFNRQNPAAWLNTLAQMKQGGRQIKGALNQFPQNVNNRFPGPSSGPIVAPCTGPCTIHGPRMCSAPRGPAPWSCNIIGPTMSNEMCAQTWSVQQFAPGASMSSMNTKFSCPAPGMSARPIGPSGSLMLGCMNNMSPNVEGAQFQNQSLSSMHINQVPGGPTTLTGVKVPDENLTPQQRQHREEQLAMIRKMQQLLFPEHQQMELSQSAMVCPQPNMDSMPAGVPPHVAHSRFGPGEMLVHSGMDACFSPHQACMSEQEHNSNDMFMGSSIMASGFQQQNFPPVSASAQLEWQKLQHQFYEERRKKQVCNNASLSHQSLTPQVQSPMQQPQTTPTQQPPLTQPLTPQQPPQNINSPSPSIGLSPGTRIQGPPPPYHQTSRRTMPSPHPASPNPSSLSLLSPRMAPSPADSTRQFPHPTPPGPRLPHPSPGPTTPAGSNSLHTTPLNSPKPMNTPGPGSNSGTLIRTPSTPSNTTSTPAGTPTSSCVVALPNSGPNTPAGSCTSNRKSNQSCSDVQDSNSGPNTSADFTPSSCSVSTSNNAQSEMFCHPCSQSSQKQEHCVGLCQKEPSLMPVPSPQQIQYLNTFDGQELTIQKQPNTSIRDLDMMSPTSMTPSIVMSTGSHSQFQSSDGTSFPNTPGSCPSVLENSQDSLSGRYPASAPANMEGTIQRFTAPSPQMPGFDTSHRQMLSTSQMGDSAIPRYPGAQALEALRIPEPLNHPMEENMSRFSRPGQHGPMYGTAPTNCVNMSRFPGSASEAMQRFRGVSPHSVNSLDMQHARYIGPGPHMSCVDNMSQSSQFNNLRSEEVQSFANSPQSATSRSSPCVGSNFLVEGNMPHSHLHNLQKMTPPFENITGSKLPSEMMSPLGQCSNSSVNESNNVNVPSFSELSPITSSAPVGPSQRLSHFDPIASMAAMSESTGPLVTAEGTMPANQNIITSNLNVSSIQAANSNQPNITNFHSNMQSMQTSLQNCSNSVQHSQFNMHDQMTYSTGCGPQTLNNTYAIAAMPMQQISLRNMATTASYNAGDQVSNMIQHPMDSGCQSNGATTLSCSVTTNHPIMHAIVTTKTSNSVVGTPGPRIGPQNFLSQPLIQRNPTPVGAAVSPTMMARGSGTAFNSTNIQVKANAPNTIQYLPARQQNTIPVPNRPPTLEFLQRFAAPLTNLDNKVPTHNLQYFPNSGGSNPSHGGNIGMSPNPGSVTPGMMNNQRPVNMMMGPIMRGPSPNISHPSGQMFPVGPGLPGTESPLFGRSPCPIGSSSNNQIVPMNNMSSGQNVAIFPNKQISLSMGVMTPDATQPLPPSMGQSFSYKQSPFYGPTTADPNYAVQFHNFQQQLYATNTRGNQLGSQNNMSGQGFFGPK